MTRGRTFLAAAFAAFLAAPALAQEYTSETFTGGYVTPPGGGTALIGPDQDDRTAEATLPFEFPFFGRVYDRVSVSSNGWLAFGSVTDTDSSNTVLPTSAGPDGIVAALWDDLHTRLGAVTTFTIGAAPDRVFVVAWEGVDNFPAADQDDLSFQVHLHETTGVVEIAYAPDGVWDGLSFTAGIEDHNGGVAFGAPNLLADNAGQPTTDYRFLPAVVTVSGMVLRDRPVADATGLGNTTDLDLPVVGADVEVVREDLGETIARGRTDVDGNFVVDALGVASPVTLRVELLASGIDARVTDTQGATYRHELASGVASQSNDIGTVRLQDAVDVTAPAFRRALNIQQAARRGFAWALDAAGLSAGSADPPAAIEEFPKLEIRWAVGVTPTGGQSAYVPAVGTVAARADISDASENPDPYDDDAVLREVGHHVFATISAHPAEATGHNWAGATSETAAFADGFAHWFACVVQGRPEFIDTTSNTTANVFDLEAATPTPAKAPAVTGAVASALWELVDTDNEPEDEFDGTIAPIPSTATDVFTAIDQGLDAQTPGYTLLDFFAHWRTGAGEETERAQTARAFIHHGAFADDANEPNDRAGEATALAAGVAKQTGLRLSPANEDHFQFVFDAASPAVLTATVTQTTAADVQVEIQDAGGTPLGTADNAAQADKSVTRTDSGGTVAAGTYTVVVRHLAGSPADYTLTLSAPLRLVTAALPEWTVGVPFKEDIVADGGVQPYAFSYTGLVPGLAPTAGGAQLEGAPTESGDFTLGIDVTDDADPAASVTSDVPLRVNPALAVPVLFGVPAGRAVDVTFASGGTNAVWTPGSIGSPAFVLTGGPTLRLAGTSAGPVAFMAGGSATDDVGAFLPDTIGTVVACAALGAGPASVSASDTHLGVYVDGLKDSRVDLEVRFKGAGGTPRGVALVNEAGTMIPLAPENVVEDGRRARVKDLILPATGRYFVIVANPQGFQGTVDGGASVRPVRRLHGQAAIDQPSTVVDVKFQAIGGSRLRVTARRGAAPTDLKPSIFGVIAPDGSQLDVLRQRTSRRGKRVKLRRLELPQDGEYTLRLASDGSTSGPLSWSLRVKRPKGVRFSVD